MVLDLEFGRCWTITRKLELAWSPAEQSFGCEENAVKLKPEALAVRPQLSREKLPQKVGHANMEPGHSLKAKKGQNKRRETSQGPFASAAMAGMYGFAQAGAFGFLFVSRCTMRMRRRPLRGGAPNALVWLPSRVRQVADGPRQEPRERASERASVSQGVEPRPMWTSPCQCHPALFRHWPRSWIYLAPFGTAPAS